MLANLVMRPDQVSLTASAALVDAGREVLVDGKTLDQVDLATKGGGERVLQTGMSVQKSGNAR
ncbi:MAG: hypothetical protein OXH76_20230 [Boseongicola sp.]|nr:hypothetical protein [Boseongicola sp.]MDE0698152.1 hypothetical protein [Boseongicola sp.]